MPGSSGAALTRECELAKAYQWDLDCPVQSARPDPEPVSTMSALIIRIGFGGGTVHYNYDKESGTPKPYSDY